MFNTVKTVATREFFHSPTIVKGLHPGQSLAVTDNGKPSFRVIKEGKRPRRTLEELERATISLPGRKKTNLVKAILEMKGR
jgi:hypothetical protein